MRHESTTAFRQYLKSLLVCARNSDDAQKYAQKNEFEQRVIRALTPGFKIRSAVNAATTGDATWAGPLIAISSIFAEYFETLRSTSALFALLPELIRIPPNTPFSITSSGATAFATDEGDYIPLTKLGFDGDRLPPRKAAAMVVLSNELLRFADPGALDTIERELRSAIGKVTDDPVITELLRDAPTTTSGGDSRGDLQWLFEAVDMGQLARPIIFLSSYTLRNLAFTGAFGPNFPDLVIPNGGSIAGVSVVALDALGGFDDGTSPPTPSNRMIVADASQIAGSVEPIDMATANQGSLVMVDNPGSGAQTEVSLFATNSTAIKLRLRYTFEKVRPRAAAMISGIGRYES